MNDFPDQPRNREEMTFADGVFSSRETFKNIAFVVVKAGESPLARMPVEIYPDRVAVRKVNLNPASELAPSVVLLTYRSAHVAADGVLDRHTNRSSVWCLRSGR